MKTTLLKALDVVVMLPNIPFILIVCAIVIITDIRQNGIKFEYEYKTTDLVPDVFQHGWAAFIYFGLIMHFMQ
jgi:hypothetical protein